MKRLAPLLQHAKAIVSELKNGHDSFASLEKVLDEALAAAVSHECLPIDTVRTTIQTVYCMGLTEFRLVFGDHMGEHLWLKFHDEKNRDVADFICALDSQNLQRLVENARSPAPILDIFTQE